MPDKKRQFAAYLAKHRKRRGLSMSDLAKAAGTTKSNISYWESGKWLPKADQLQPLAEALGVSYEDLFAIAGYASPEALPEPTPYLRAKYPDAPKKALAEADRFFRQFDKRYGKDDDAD